MPTLDHWDTHAKNWHLVGAPLRPSEVDIRVFERIAKRAPRAGVELEAVLLGATEELVSMEWPERSRLQVVEREPAMLARLSAPGAPVPTPDVVVQQFGDWRSMSAFAQRSQDLVLGDGCFTTLTFDEYDRVISEIHRVLRPGGHFAHRFFLQTEPQEQPIDVWESWLASSSVGNFHANKLRLLMSMQKSFTEGVSVHSVWQLWEERLAEHAPTASDEVAKTIEAYRDSAARYTFPTATELKEKLDAKFNVDFERTPHGYWLAERCPTIVCTRKEDE